MNAFYLRLEAPPVVETWPPRSQSHQGHLHGRSYTPPNKECRCYIIPPHIQESIRAHKERNPQEVRDQIIVQHARRDQDFRKLRAAHYAIGLAFHWPHPHPSEETPTASTDPTQQLTRTVYDADNRERLPGELKLSATGAEGLPGYTQTGTSEDTAVNQAFTNALAVFTFYLKNYQHNSIDGKGMPIASSVHFGEQYENAFWDGRQMVYGDGSDLFDSFPSYLDVVGHEMTHGVTGNRLKYKKEAGALNEHFSDVMGYMVYMYQNQLSFDQANWLLADGILKWDNKRYPLRSFASPGTAYDIPEIGKDPQPATYGSLYKGKEDNGGVHINSGIPNHAFYLFAQALGGKPWETAGLIWFKTMMSGSFKRNAKMKDFAQATLKVAKELFPGDMDTEQKLRGAWKTVEVIL